MSPAYPILHLPDMPLVYRNVIDLSWIARSPSRNVAFSADTTRSVLGVGDLIFDRMTIFLSMSSADRSKLRPIIVPADLNLVMCGAPTHWMDGVTNLLQWD